MQEFITLTRELQQEAGEIARKYFRQNFAVDAKDDASPVTIADRTIEEALRERLEKNRPDDGIIGEEFGIKDSKSGLTWVIDPIDGTKSFVIGRPTFGTLIALWEDDKPLVGSIFQPISEEHWLAGPDHPTTLNGRPVKVRPCPALKQACAGSTTPEMFEDQLSPVLDLLSEKTKMMAWGGDCYMYGLLASGHMDLCVENLLSTYDFAALVPIVQGAGGIMTDWKGRAITLSSARHVVASGDRRVHDPILEMLGNYF